LGNIFESSKTKTQNSNDCNIKKQRNINSDWGRRGDITGQIIEIGLVVRLG